MQTQQTQPIKITKIEIKIKCKDLTSNDLLSKSDPCAIVYLNNQIVGKTEIIKNDSNPHFKQPIVLPYNFEETQSLRFILVDIDGNGDPYNFSDNDKIGETTVTLGKILSSSGGTYKGELTKNSVFAGTIVISTEEIHETNENILFKVQGIKLDKKDVIGSTDGYFNIYKSGGTTLVYKSEVIKDSLNPVFKPVFLKLSNLNSGDLNAELTFEFMDEDIGKKHDLIGRFTTTTNELLNGCIGGAAKEYQLVHPKKIGKSSYSNSGTIKFTECQLRSVPSFLDYLMGGLQIDLTVAIDCTSSNKDVNSETSLHYNTPICPSSYAKTIMTVGNVLSSYDYDQLITVYGYGGEHNGRTSHCFPFNKSDHSCNVTGVTGVLEVYNKYIQKIDFSFPAHLEPVVGQTVEKASKYTNNLKYSILLIISNGNISDVQKTIDSLVTGSAYPMSVIIVGVGSHDFTNIKKLEGGHHGLVDSNAHHAKRSISQFIAFKDFENNLDALANETLKKIPSQVLSYMNANKILPNTPKSHI